MKNRGKVPQKQYDEFLASFLTAMPEITLEQAQAWIRLKKTTQRGKLRKLFIGDTKSATWANEHVRFYQEVFGLKVDLSKVKLPPETKGFGWTVAIAKELGDKPLAKALAACEKLFPTYSYLGDNPDKSVPTNDRDPRRDGSYAIRVRDREEADEELKDMSANDIKSRGLATMTLLERIVLELFYFWKFKNHLDIKNWTLCGGSRNSDGDVPGCRWRGGRFKVDWGGPGGSCDALRARSAVSV